MPFKITNCLHLTILFYILRNCECYQDSIVLKPIANEAYCYPPFKDIGDINIKQVTIIFAENTSDAILEDCLLKKRSIGLSVLLLRDHEHLLAIPKKKIKMFQYTHFNPLLVVVMHDLNIEIMYHPTTRSIFKSHLSTVYIEVTTRDTKYACVEGIFEDKVYKTIDVFLNRIWHEYEIFVVIVEFPFVCPDYFVIYNEKRPSDYDLYDRTITTVPKKTSESQNKLIIDSLFNLTRDYPLRANIFERFPTSINECHNMHYYLKVDEKYLNGMCGMDAYVMNDILHRFQFKSSFPVISDSEGYGFVYNNTITGSLGHLLRNEFDISFNSRFLVQYLEEDKIHFLHYISFDSICAVMKRPDFLPLWYYTFNFFKPSTWGVFLCLITLCSVANKVLERIRKTMGKVSNSSNIMELISIGVFGWYYNKRTKVSILGGMCLLISLVTCALFQGHVNYVYTTLVRSSTIKTLAELHSSNNKVYTSTSFYKMLGSDMQSQLIPNPDKTIGDLLSDKHMALLRRKFDMILEIRKDYSDENGIALVYIVQECYCSNYLSYITRQGFPFANQIKVYIMMLLEAGLPDAYYRLTQNALGLAARGSSQKSLPRPFIPSNMPEFRVAFSFLCLGYFVSFVTLVIERWWARRNMGNTIKFVL